MSNPQDQRTERTMSLNNIILHKSAPSFYFYIHITVATEKQLDLLTVTQTHNPRITEN